MIIEFKLPDLGENIHAADVVKVRVSPGDRLEKDQTVLEIETDKAAVEVPSTVSGVVKEVFVMPGTKAKVGQVLLTVEADARVESASPLLTTAESNAPKSKPPSSVIESRRSAPVAITPSTLSMSLPEAVRSTAKLVPAAPTVRRFAREIGVNINDVPGSGPGDRISIDDVKRFARKASAVMPSGGGFGIRAVVLPDFSKWGPIETEAMSNIRRKIAEQMSYAWTIPHVFQSDKADITQLEEIRKQFSKRTEIAGGKLTMTAILLKALACALKKFPKFNASIDLVKSEIIYKKYVHIGVAVDTDRGLLVPVICDADQKSILQLAVEMTEMAEKARTKKLSLEEMQGGTFTITNLGGIGGGHFAPIINAPEVAILGVGRGAIEPVYLDGQFVPRLMLPISVSYDHRLIDGADAARFLRWVATSLEQPFQLLFE